jgi:predicted ATP-grasp superfamily ATP-dependent carboligase
MNQDQSLNSILIHNLSYPHLNNYRNALNRDQRSIVCARPGDVVLTRDKIDPNFIKYLSKYGWDFSKVKFHSLEKGKNSQFDSIFTDPKMIEFVSKTRGYLDTYHLTNLEDTFAGKVGKPLLGNVKMATRYGTKSGFRKLAKKLSLPIPDGYEFIKNTDQAMQAISNLHKKGKKAVGIKINCGADGFSTTLINLDKFLQYTTSRQKAIVRKAFTKLSSDGDVVSVEEWIPEVISSPAVIVNILPNKKTEIVLLYDQILKGKLKGYVGAIYPSSTLKASQKQDIKEMATSFAKYLALEGYRGIFGLDFILTKSGQIYLIEANIRKVGTYYSVVAMNKLFKNRIGKICFKLQVIESKFLKGKDFSFLEKRISSKVFRNKNEGVLILYVGELETSGRVEIVSYGKDSRKVKLLSELASELLYNYRQPVISLARYYVKNILASINV